MFTQEQIGQLEQKLSVDNVKVRQQGNIQLSYVEGYYIIETLNRIIGYGNWSYDVKELSQVSEEINEKNNKVIGYKAIITLTIHDVNHTKSITRTDVGYGIGISKDYASAHESAGKEACTDGLKRVAKSLGNPYGLALYDKQQRNVARSNQQQNQLPQSHNNQHVQQQNKPVTGYESLKQLGLEVQEQNGILVVLGQTFGKQQTLKELQFFWDAKQKIWWKNIDQQAA